MKKENKFGPNKLGFSLIELSIVILVIGILVIGITKGSRIIAEARLKSARSLTANSPANATPNLMLWLDTTSEKSFDSSVANGSTIANWYDLNNQTTNRNNATQSTATNQPTYNTNIINGLPVLSFDGNDNFMSFNGLFLNGGNYTIFFVEQRTSGKSDNTLMGDSASSSSGLILRYSSSTTLRLSQGGSGFNASVATYSAPLTRVLTFKYNGTTAGIYINGGTPTTNSMNAVTGITSEVIGSFNGGGYYQGNIAEVIIFNRALSNGEQQGIENYLNQKWKVY